MVAVKATARARVRQAPRVGRVEPAPFDALSALSGERRRVRAVLARHGVEPSDIEDMASVVMLAAVESIGTFRPSEEPLESLRAWLLHGICRNLASHYREALGGERRKLARRGVQLLDVVEPSPEELHAARERLAVACEAIATLPALTREVFTRYRVDGESIESIAGSLGMPASTAYKRLYAAAVVVARADARSERAPLSRVQVKR